MKGSECGCYFCNFDHQVKEKKIFTRCFQKGLYSIHSDRELTQRIVGFRF
jgi:hypothetical protein